MRQLQGAVQACAAWMMHHLPRDDLKEDGSPRLVALFIENNIGLFFYLAAALEMGIPVMLLSARLSPASVRHLMKETQCRSVLVSKRFQAMLGDELPSSAEIVVAAHYIMFLDPNRNPNAALSARGAPPERPRVSFPLILHSSGTTGLPKPIPVGEQYPIVYAACHEFPEDLDISWTNLSTLPLYHGFGLLAPCLSLSMGLTCCLLPSTTIPAAQSTADLLEACAAGSLMTVPLILSDMLADAAHVRRLQPLRFVAVGGALAPETARQLVHDPGVALLNHCGATELGALAATDFRYLWLREDRGLVLQPMPWPQDAGEGAGAPPQRYKLVGMSRK